MYLVRIKGRSVYCLDRSAKPRVLSIDPTEYRFKLALVKRNYEEMLSIIKNSSLVGQSVISYLQKKGYPEIALQFVQDPQTRFELAIECGNLEVAVEMAKQLDRPKLWARLGTEALAHGNHQIVEMAYQKQRQFDKLSFLYLCTGDKEKLSRMAKISEHRGDATSRFQNSLYLGDVTSRIEMLKDIDMCKFSKTCSEPKWLTLEDPLAYATAKAHGLEDECKLILDASGLTEDQVTLPEIGASSDLPQAIVPTHQANWPVKAASYSFFQKALLGEVEGVEDGVAAVEGFGEEEATEANGTTALEDGLGGAEEEDDAAGWDMGEDINVEVESDFVNVEGAEGGTGSSEADNWTRNSPLAADHVAGGSFETAMQLLNRQIGAVNFQPLKPRFMQIYQASRTFLPATAGLPPLVNYIRRTVEETDPRKVLPIIPRDLESIAAVDLQEGYSAMKGNKLDDGLPIFKRILHSLMVNAVQNQTQVAEARRIIGSAMQYGLAMSIELQRRKTGEDNEADIKRNLELAAYFTIPTLEVPHRNLALMAALKQATKHKNHSAALSFANRIIANGGAARLLDQVCFAIPYILLLLAFLCCFQPSCHPTNADRPCYRHAK